MNDDILLAKAESVERCIARIRDSYLGHEAELATSRDLQDVIVVNLQRACQSAIDMANRIVRLRRLGLPKDAADAFGLLVRARLISDELGAAMRRMVGFRNVAVHQYREIDIDRLRILVEERLGDLSILAKTLAEIGSEPGPEATS